MKSFYNKYLTLDGNKKFSANSQNKADAEVFKVEIIDINKIALQVYPGGSISQAQYVGSDHRGNLFLAPKKGSWEEWTIESSGGNTIGLKSFHGNYLSTDYSGDMYGAPNLQDGQTWTYEPAPGDQGMEH